MADQESDSSAGSPTDWISAVCSVIAAAIALITVITVYIAARQLLTEHQTYQMGLSEAALGPWCTKVNRKKSLGMRQQISTPIITLPALIKSNWNPEIGYPMDFGTIARDPLFILEKAIPKASWVNFIEELGIAPGDSNLYQMIPQSNLVNGIVPMRWAGKDLVSICNILGFQSCEDKPSFKTPMPLPMQWSGPLGWLQFRESPDGCIAEYRRRAIIEDQLPVDLHGFYMTRPYKSDTFCLKARLWRNIHGLYLKNGNALYLGGASKDIRQNAGVALQKLQKLKGLLETLDETLDDAKKRVAEEDAPLVDRSQNEALFKELMDGTFTSDEVAEKLGVKSEKSDAAAAKDDDSDSDKRSKRPEGTKEFFKPCKGLLSIVVEGELAYSRGLNITQGLEYIREVKDIDDADLGKFKYNLGNLYMDDEMLPHWKEALELLRPDGYYFTSTGRLASDIDDVYQHVEDITELSNKTLIFPEFQLTDWPASHPNRAVLCSAMMLCNAFQRIRTHNRAMFTVRDMVAVAKASQSLRQVYSTPDLAWALLVCPKLCADLAEAFEDFQDPSLFGNSNTTVRCQGGRLDCTGLLTECGAQRRTTRRSSTSGSTTLIELPRADGEYVYDIPLCADGEFSASELLAAFMDVMVRFYWVDKRWISDVGLYDGVIPPTITMC